jgi:uncharacterized protein involved in exopolysaccharide biosynthesis
MNKTQNINAMNQSIDDESGFLDFLTIFAENLKLLSLGPLLVGLSALGVGLLLPAKFQSVTTLRAEALTPTQITAAPVLDPIVEKLDLMDNQSIVIAREKLRDRLNIALNRNEKLISITVSERTPELAQSIATALVHQILEESKPKGFVREQLVAQRQLAEKRVKESSAMLTHLTARIGTAGYAPGNSDAVQGYAELQKVLAEAEAQVLSTQLRLEGLTTSSVVQPPTLTHTTRMKKVVLLFLIATIISGALLFLFVFLRHSLRQQEFNPIAKEKLARLRKTVGLKELN